MQHFDTDIAILGGGCIGMSIFHALGRTLSLSVILIDDLSTQSATQQSGGLWRVFHENLAHTKLALQHYELAEHLGISKLLHQCGSLYLFNRKRLTDYQASLHLLEKNHYPFELLTAAAASKRFPEFIFKSEDYVLYEPLGGKINPRHFLKQLQSASPGLQVNQMIREIICSRHHFLLQSNSTRVRCRYLILAGGYSLIPTLSTLGIGLPLSTKPITTYHAALQTPLNLPYYFDRETLEFAASDGAGQLLSSTKDLTRFKRPILTAPPKKNLAYDCYAPNRLGYLGTFSHHPNLYLATGWGGTGFKFSLAIGEKTAQALAK